ncbi:biopolymer transport protein [Burkholderia sp. Ch1-1]|uniref:Biopolymer transport protein exbD1 n=1 Tax=Paraburkholderia dioscoreae TaxID=2604047 RepID=A0A5Q4ZJZ3_9BURK|nr:MULTISPECIES: biopolymer transporter ExbD [Paraburkholderia]EIF33069.1 biopolymer transport protein [Burkholderia sp. Ch1-1]MDR8401376.1 biopolymer transporter ExbD [Paraburkholderia sp. USG1]VVD31886.1 Biopolymer transport protein exbD1 [Paraburkholderia dioscoreae]
MAMTPFSDDEESGLMNEINMTPLVDVMLVLLIIFLVTIPAMQHAVKIDLPQASSQPDNVKPAHLDVAVQADGSILWDGHPVADDVLRARIAEAAHTKPQPELHLRADRKVPYERVADVMSAAQAGGLTKIGFVTDPREKK